MSYPLKTVKPKWAIHHVPYWKPQPVEGKKRPKMVRLTEAREVMLMTICGTWAMVRRPGCAPYICPKRQLEIP